MCSAGSRVLVRNSIYNEFVAAFKAAARAYAPGNPLDRPRMGRLWMKCRYERDAGLYPTRSATKAAA